jgi:hypothetical protein
LTVKEAPATVTEHNADANESKDTHDAAVDTDGDVDVGAALRMMKKEQDEDVSGARA